MASPAELIRLSKKFGVEVHEMKDWQGPPAFSFDGPLYISFDMDALDPASAPGVSHWEPGGLSLRDVLQVLQQITAKSIGTLLPNIHPPLSLTIHRQSLEEVRTISLFPVQ